MSRIGSKPWYVTKLVKPATAEEVDYYGNAFAVISICECGRAAEIPGAYKAAEGSGDVNFAELRKRLKCRVCGRREPKIKVYRRPRE